MLEKLQKFFSELSEEEFNEVLKNVKDVSPEETPTLEDMKVKLQKQIDQKNLEAYNKSVQEIYACKQNVKDLKIINSLVHSMMEYYENKIKTICPHPKEDVIKDVKTIEGGYLNVGYHEYTYTCKLCGQIVNTETKDTGYS